MRKPKLNQVIAVEKGIKTRVYAEFTELHKATQKQELLDGFSKIYTPKEEGGDVLPPESKKVQYQGSQVMRQVAKILGELFDVTAQKDWANCSAAADVVVGDTVIVEKAPPTFLMFLDKQLSDLLKFVSAFGELDAAVDWNFDGATGLYKSEPIKTRRAEKKKRAIVLYDATDKHPAQTQLIDEDIVVGYWETTKFSGALPRPEKMAILERIQTLLNAVKQALEVANQQEAPSQAVAVRIFDYLFGGKL